MKSFRTRLTIWNAAVLLVVLVSFGISAAVLTERAVLRGIDQEITQFLRRGPGGPPSGAGPGQRAPMPMELRTPRFINDPNGPRSISPDGQAPSGQPILSQKGFEAARDFEFDLRTETVDGRAVRVGSIRRPMPDGGWQVVQVGRDLTDARAALSQQRAILVLMLPIAVFVAVVGGLVFVRRALKPVEDVTQAAMEIGAEDLGRRLVVEGDDELAELARTFNGMIERLDRSFADLEESFERQKRFTADASHELRTPLSRVKLVSSAALSQETSEEERIEALRTIDRSADEMTALVDGLLQLARAEAGTLSLVQEPFDLARTVQEAVATVGDGRVSYEPVALRAVGDADAVRSIVVNFLTNAVRHTPDSGHVSVSLSSDLGQSVVRVEDDGEGIPPEHLAHIKERFYRADSSRNRSAGGTGLGLSICDALATGMGGTIEVTSQVGKGTVARLILPSA